MIKSNYFITLILCLFVISQQALCKDSYTLFMKSSILCDTLKVLFKEIPIGVSLVKDEGKNHIYSNPTIYSDTVYFKYNKRKISINKLNSTFYTITANNKAKKATIQIYTKSDKLLYKKKFYYIDPPFNLFINGFMPTRTGIPYKFDSIILQVNTDCISHHINLELFDIKKYSLDIERNNKTIYSVIMMTKDLSTIKDEVYKILKPNDLIILRNVVIINKQTNNNYKIKKQIIQKIQ